MSRLLRRLSRLTVGELRFRVAEGGRTAAEAVAFGTGGTAWRRERLRSRLAIASSDLVTAVEALRRRQWHKAHAALRAHFVKRPVRFPIDPARRNDIAAGIAGQFPLAAGDARRRGDRLLEGRRDLLGYRDLSFGDPASGIDWHADPVHGRTAPRRFWARVPYLDPACGDHKVIWELNRHQHWLALGRAAWLTGDRRYEDAFVHELEHWLRANPPLTGINWSSMLELAFRSISWIWALHFFAASDNRSESPWLVDLLLGIDRQLDHVSRHLSTYFSPNTHLLGEGLALYVGGRVLPELKSAGRWDRLGRGVLLREADRQVLPDGGHIERSTHYHRYALDFYLLALTIARQTGDPIAGRFAEVTSRMATWCRAMADDSGLLPTIGDDDGGMLMPMCGRRPADVRDTLALAASLLGRPELAIGETPEEALWMLGGRPDAAARPEPTATPSSQVFPASGYAVLRSAEAHAVLDAGRHGFLNGGHAHADALSLVLTVGGRPLLIDPGTALYTIDPELRDRFRSTAMHNTATIDGRPQSIPGLPFQWRSAAHARLDAWRPGGRFDFVEALHDGYLPVVHRRAVLRAPDGLWLVADHFLGSGVHRADIHWHFDPAWSLEDRSRDAARLVHQEGPYAAFAATADELTDAFGEPGGRGWCAPIYGQLIPSVELGASTAAELPVSAVTAIGCSATPVELSVATTAVRIERPDHWQRIAVAGRLGPDRIVALFSAPNLRPSSGSPAPRAVQHVAAWGGELATDARVAFLRLSRTLQPTSLVLIDATAASWHAPGCCSLAIGPRASAGDLHFDRTTLERLSRKADVTPVGQGG